MHAVDRGPEPSRLAAVRKRYTPRWVRFYPDRQGNKPSDSKWRDFHEELSGRFFSLCAYCERQCKGEVEHVRPKSKFPEKVYEWSTWVLACHTCNHSKSNKWPRGGYVDPCAKSPRSQPEAFFDFDTKTGEIVTRTDLTPSRLRKATQTIKDLGLNAYHLLKARMHHLRFLERALRDRSYGDLATAEIIRFGASRENPFSSLARAWFEEQQYSSPE